MIKSNILTSDYLLDNSLKESTQLPISELIHHNLQEENELEPAWKNSTEKKSEDNIFDFNLSAESDFKSENLLSTQNNTFSSTFSQDRALLSSLPNIDRNTGLDNEEISIDLSASAGDPNSSLEGVFGNDDRTKVTNTTSDPWSKVGFVKTRFGNKWSGSSGVMIGPHHFLTSAHGIFDSTKTDSAGNGGYADEIKLYLGQDGEEKYYGEVGVTRFHTVKGYTADNDGDGIIADADPNENEGNYDWAVLTLDRNIGDHTGWMGWQWNSDLSWYNGLDVNITGYPRDTINSDGTIKNNWTGDFSGTDFSASMYTSSGKLDSADRYQLKDFIDGTGGNSGGPVWRSEGNSEYVVGLVRATISNSEGTPIRNEELRLQKYITDLIEKWKTNDPNPSDKPDFVDYDDWFNTDFAYFRNNTTGEVRDDLSFSTVDVGVGDSITFRSVIRNNSTARVDGFYLTEPKVNVSFYASTNEIISSYDHKIGEVNISAIDPFKWSNATLNTAFPDLPEGQYHIGYKVSSIMSEFSGQVFDRYDDSGNKVFRSNNIGKIDGSKINVVHEKDLSGYSFDVVQEPLNAGDTFDVNFAIENSESYRAGQFAVNFYLSENNTITTSDRFLGSYSVTSLAGNSNTNTLNTTLTLPDASDSVWNGDGDYHVGMVIDALSQVKETNESNNDSRGELIDYDRVQIITSSDLQGTSDNDLLLGTPNNDIVYGLAGKDTINGAEGNDELYGESGNDKLRGEIGNDTLYGGEDRDNLNGGEGNDELYGGSGNDKLQGKNGDDELFGGLDRDKLLGGNGNDYLAGGADDDILKGNHGNDNLVGDSGNDTLKGNSGDDLLSGNEGNDFLKGGSGADSFIFYSWDEGIDKIKDFNEAEGDLITIYQSGFGANAQFSYDNSNGDLFFNGSDTVNGTHQIATLVNNPTDFDIDRHLKLV